MMREVLNLFLTTQSILLKKQQQRTLTGQNVAKK